MTAAPARLLERLDPDLLGDVDQRCLAFDRLLGHLHDCLSSPLGTAALAYAARAAGGVP